MSTLVLDEIRDGKILTQEFESKKRARVFGIRPNLYFHNIPSGDVLLEIKNGSEVLGSKQISVTDLRSSASVTDNFAHGYFLFEFDKPIAMRAKTYNIEVSGVNGYTFSDSAYLGWIKEHDPLKVNTGPNLGDPFKNAFSYQLWRYE